jgi:long-chain fatty acid transport protein
MFFLPHFYAATDFGLERWRFGLGFNVPFGNSIDWGKTFQYLVTKSDLVVYNIAPTIACQLNEHLSLGVGLNIYVANTTLEREVSPLLLPGGGHFRFHGESTSLGATVGSLWTINEHNSVGVVYRSPFTEDFAGTASLKGNPFGFDGHAPAHAGIRFPQSVAVGYALRPTRKLKLEVDVEWTNWDTLNTVVLHAPTSPLFNNTPTPFNWKDSFFYEFGAQYDLSERWAARAGYIFSENTVPSSSFSPVLPDSNRHVFSAGLGHVGKQMNVDVVYQYSLSTDRTIKGAGNPLAGEWSSSGHAVMFTSTLKF